MHDCGKIQGRIPPCMQLMTMRSRFLRFPATFRVIRLHRPDFAPTVPVRMLLGLLATLLAGTASAQSLPPPVTAALARAGIPLSAAAVWTQPIGGARAGLAVNSSKPMNPASTIKLLTTYAALELLGPAYSWKTEVWASGTLSEGALEGDLVLRGGGDPRLTVEHLWQLVQAVRSRGVRDIRGGLILDRSYFDITEQDPSRFDSEPLRPYNVAPDALLVNFKAFRFTFVPDAERRVANVVVEPRSTMLEVSSGIALNDEPCGDWRRNLRTAFPGAGATRGAKAVFGGSYPASCSERTMNVALLSHSDYVYGVFAALWKESGGTIAGGWRDQAVPQGSRLIYAHESPALSEVVRDINKFSNNVMARQLFLTLSAEIEHVPGRAETSTALLRRWLEGKGLAMPELALENGSGLSRRESISAENLGRLLISAFASPVMPEFVASLPLLAVDGTMRRRLKTDSAAGQAHLKTGSLSDVRSVAGYILDRHGRRHALVLIINHPNAAAAQPAQDAFIRWIYDPPN